MQFNIKTAFTAVTLFAALIVSADAFPFERINKNDSMLVILDHQVGLYSLARDFDATLFNHAMLAHAALGKVFSPPVVMTTSAEMGPNGPLAKEILDMYPSVPVDAKKGVRVGDSLAPYIQVRCKGTEHSPTSAGAPCAPAVAGLGSVTRPGGLDTADPPRGSRSFATPVVKRNGEVDAWDKAEFRAAVQATGKPPATLLPYATAPSP
ncbi:hypothetical protein MAPG_11334 [Magnaporthiopsis poae ATCC 64411]|uniref:Isochorismatase-like domain-containing protein n=1 Tax=Magnaporthiopsis poae (strain ATCC 64411 / 73-15) TaxID=644358 RepID=A0A0C4EF01_MAGP6|nr:hypothetical protein MAPG_11334 [Magnaporthiopsis poae ATCC 64411]